MAKRVLLLLLLPMVKRVLLLLLLPTLIQAAPGSSDFNVKAMALQCGDALENRHCVKEGEDCRVEMNVPPRFEGSFQCYFKEGVILDCLSPTDCQTSSGFLNPSDLHKSKNSVGVPLTNIQPNMTGIYLCLEKDEKTIMSVHYFAVNFCPGVETSDQDNGIAVFTARPGLLVFWLPLVVSMYFV